MFLKKMMKDSTGSCSDKIGRIRKLLEDADAVVIGAGAGLSTSAGFVYDGERFTRYFSDFGEKYGFSDMYSGGFYPYQTQKEHWAYWSRYIYLNRYLDAPKPVYEKLYDLVKKKDYFVLTTNVDHCFQKAGFDKRRLFYTQGDYGLFQCSEPCCQETYDNEEMIRNMVVSQGFLAEDGSVRDVRQQEVKSVIPEELVPHCPKCGKVMSMNLRADATFVEDAGWHRASERYQQFLQRHKRLKIVFLELGVGYNTPGIIKYPFWQMTAALPDAAYVCLNYGEAYVSDEIREQSVCVNGDIGEILNKL